MRYYILLIMIILGGLFLPMEGYGGIIRTSIVSHARVVKPGQIDMDVEVLNTGNVTAYNVEIAIFLADWAYITNNLGHNSPGGKLRFSTLCNKSPLRPGKYTGIIRARFEERSGKRHKAYHFFEVFYNMDQASKYDSRLYLQLKVPVFNTKALWQRNGNIRLSMKNDFPETVRPNIAFYPSDGFTIQKPIAGYELSPGENKVEVIPLSKDASVTQNGTYHLVVWYEYDGVHYSHRLQQNILVEERPLYFRWYLVFGAISSMIIFGIILYHSRKKL